jgi:hypothetical protein
MAQSLRLNQADVIRLARETFTSSEVHSVLTMDERNRLLFSTAMFRNKARCRVYFAGEHPDDARTFAVYIVDRRTGAVTNLHESNWPLLFG